MARQPVNVFLDNGTKDVAAIADAVSGASVVIDFAHHELHEGDHYYATGTTTLGIGEVLNILIVTPNTTKWAHLEGQIGTSGTATVGFYEGSTTSAAGSAVTEFNRNRNSANTAAVVVTTGPTITGDGTLIFTAQSGAGQRVGGDVRAQNEFILKQNTKYILRVTSAVATNVTNWLVDWYEHVNNG